MTQQALGSAPGRSAASGCDPAGRTTKTLLAYGAIAGPVYVAVSLAQALTRDGFDLTRHQWSMLANGDFGWIQITNLVVTGLMTVAMAVGLRRALRPGRGATWAPRLVGAYGLGMIAAGVFRADPAFGFPAGTPDGSGQVSWHGMLHFASAGIGFACLVAACLVLARRFAVERRRGWAAFSRVTGVVFLACFGAMAVSGGASWATVAFVAGVLLAFGWVSALAVHLYRRTAA
jgi:uncharacterized protein DUF998